jgi:hypothetical protein
MLVTDEYKAYAKTLQREARCDFNAPSMQRFVGDEPLIDAGFLRVSDKYMHWVREHASGLSQIDDADQGPH